MIREASIAQRGHSAAEDAVYRRLWANGTEQADGARVTSIGAAQLAEETAMSRSTALRAVRGLETKLSIQLIEKHEPVTHKPRRYRVRTWAEIIAARGAAGLRWAERRPGGKVELLTDDQADARPRADWTPGAWFARHAPPRPTPAVVPDPPRVAPRPSQARAAAPAEDPAAQLRARISEAIAHIPGVSADTAAQLIASCAQNGPVQAARIERAVRVAVQIAAKSHIRAPLHFLLKMVPRTYAGPGYELDATKQRRADAEADERIQAAQDEAAAAARIEAIAPTIRAAARATWRTIADGLQERILRQSWETWIKPLKGISIEGRVLYVHMPSPEFGHIGEKFAEQIDTLIAAHSLQIEHLRFMTDAQLARLEDA